MDDDHNIKFHQDGEIYFSRDGELQKIEPLPFYEVEIHFVDESGYSEGVVCNYCYAVVLRPWFDKHKETHAVLGQP